MTERILINFHMHSTGSDGIMEPEEVVKEAIAAGIKYMCFTDHYKDPEGFLDPGWSTEGFYSREYRMEVKKLQKKYADKIDISVGVELDWLEKFKNWTKQEIDKNNFDYVLGSVHLLPLADKHYSFDFGDGKDAEFMEVVAKFGSIEKFVSTYYGQLRLLIKSRMYDTVGHFDYLKRYNTNERIFSEESGFYKKQVLETLEELAKSGMAMEINLRGLMKSLNVQYPNLWIIKEAKKRNIPLTIGTDAHTPGQVGKLLDKAYELAKEAGYTEIVRFKARKMIKIPLV